MKTQDFLREVAELVRAQVPSRFRAFQTTGPMGSLIKLHFGDPHIHYEVWIQRRHQQVEVGLHFEGKPAVNSSYLESLSARFPEIQSALGIGVEPEQWTSTWTRIHQSMLLKPLDEDFLWEVSSQLSRMIGVLEPTVRDQVTLERHGASNKTGL